MIRLILLIVLFLLSLLTVFRAPTNWLWYVSILITEFSWLFFSIVILLIVWNIKTNKYALVSSLAGIASLLLYAVPLVTAYRLAPQFRSVFFGKDFNADHICPFHFMQMFTGINAKQISCRTFTYNKKNELTLDFYPSVIKGKKPCVIVVHGGSWAGGDSKQLPELNSELAKNGYHVAAINYRLAPKYQYPAPVEDVKDAIDFLRAHAQQFSIDTSQFILLGRSAGGQIVLSAAYLLRDPSVKGVIDFYGPADMVWGYANPTNPLVLNSRKVMEDYLGGTYNMMPEQYTNSSATETATGYSPVTLLIHGENDPLVSPLHGVRLGKKLDKLSVKHYDIYLPWATHAFDYTLNGPGGQISTWSVLQFLKIVTGK